MSRKQKHRTDHSHIVYDPDIIEQPDENMFSCDYIEDTQGLIGRASGRGETCFFQYSDKKFALRHYRRGGLIARLIKDKYLGFQSEKTRAFREFNLLQNMRELNLPVPLPVAARVSFSGIFYRADLITELLEKSEPLADVLEKEALAESGWQEIGRCIRRFHDNSVFHSDLNARNIMLDDNAKVYLIDFDRCEIKNGEGWKEENLSRLRRSLDKFLKNSDGFNFSEQNWENLTAGYQGK